MTDREERCYVFRRDEVLVRGGDVPGYSSAEFFASMEGFQLFAPRFAGASGTQYRVGCVADDAALPEGVAAVGLRQVAFSRGEAVFAEAGHAFSLFVWLRDSRFCGRCGAAMRDGESERVRECPSCGFLRYPLVTPVVIVAVEREGRLLLARGPGFPPGRMSVLAGFVEPGESLEEAVRREVLEETGVVLGELHYFASQPWPFPHSLMVGFRAVATNDALSIDEKEIVEAGWFLPDAMPDLPPPWTISRKLINAFLADNRGTGA